MSFDLSGRDLCSAPWNGVLRTLNSARDGPNHSLSYSVDQYSIVKYESCKYLCLFFVEDTY